MKRMLRRIPLMVMASVALPLASLAWAAEGQGRNDPKSASENAGFVKTFAEDKADLGPTGRNDYFILEPGYTLSFKGIVDGAPVERVITVLDETKDVDGVKTRVVEERESSEGKVDGIFRSFYAISRKTKNVYCFGEESKAISDGKVVSTAGSWEAGKNGARYGLIMPAKPKVGEKYYEEYAPKEEAEDRAVIVSLTAKVKVPAGTFKNCLKVREYAPVEGGSEIKTYAPGIGLVEGGGLKLVKYGMKKK